MRNLKVALAAACAVVVGWVLSASAALAAGEAEKVRVTFYSPSIVRVVKTPDGRALPPKPVDVIVAKPMSGQPAAKDEGGCRVWRSDELTVRLDLKTGALAFLNPDGTAILREKDAAVFPATNYNGRAAIRPTQRFALPDDEEIYGLGDLQEDGLNHRGRTRRLQVANVGDGLPYFCSPRGWSVFWDSMAPTWYRDVVGDSLTMESEIGPGVDYYFIRGGDLAGTVKGMRKLTGDAPMLPLDCYGFWQSRERYRTQEEIVGALRSYREAGIPLDGIVQDWHYWGGNDTWNSMQFVAPDYANPKLMVDAIHRLNAKVMISIWPSFGPKTAQYAELKGKGLLLPFDTYPAGARLYDCFSSEARDIYFRYLRNLVDAGIDSWWMDASDTDQRFKEGMFEHVVANGCTWREVVNGYPYETVHGVYEKLRARGGRRPFILTRAGFPGQQRFAAAVWSGDTIGTWMALRRQIPSGVSFSLTGNPNWNCDIGGFVAGFYRWYTGMSTDNPAWRELYARWLQYGVFQPMMRSHGTQIPRELYLYGRPGEPLYDALVGAVKLRYRLLPYIYSTAWQVSRHGASFMMPVDGRGDAFLFGDAFFVQPIAAALYTREARAVGPSMVDWVLDKTVTFDLPEGGHWRGYWDSRKLVPGGQKLTVKLPMDSLSPAYVEDEGLAAPKDTDFSGLRDYRITLPKGVWYDFETGERIEGGRSFVRKVGIGTVPAYVRAGSIIPIGPDVQYSGEKPWDDLEVRVYPGADGTFTLYDDAGDGFGYEKGEYTECVFAWNDRAQKLDVRDPKKRKFRVKVVTGKNLHFRY